MNVDTKPYSLLNVIKFDGGYYQIYPYLRWFEEIINKLFSKIGLEWFSSKAKFKVKIELLKATWGEPSLVL